MSEPTPPAPAPPPEWSATAPAAPDPDARTAILAVRDEVGKVVVGQDGTLSGLVAALLARGHVLLEGVPGVAKTLIVKTIAAAFDLEFKRVQFTPDLMPSDVTGQLILDGRAGAGGSALGGSGFRFRPGPVFTNVLLADEINRTPPKTQAALLESMEERQVTVEGDPHPLPDPFIVIATQNPIEYEGTYPLPEAQLDRFLFKLSVTYPSAEQEQEVLARHDRGLDPHDTAAAGVRPVATAAHLAAARRQIQDIRVDPAVLAYIVALARATRTAPAVTLGVSPRGAAMVLHAAKAWAWLAGRSYVTPDEVKAVVKPSLRHRIQLRPELELEGTTIEGVLDGVLASVPVPR
jgi:MoxR-like ATPase